MNYLEDSERPWGNWFVLEEEENYKIKKLVVKPGHRLSLQSHQHRSEHWIVVSGQATFEVQIGDSEQDWVKTYNPSQYCFVPKGSKHRISNQGKQDVVIIEVQYGHYTGEDDIIRYQDDYKRV